MRRSMFITTLALLAPQPALFAADSQCESSPSLASPSPDGHWIANVQEVACSTATGAAAGITVVVVSASDATRSKRVFITPVPRSRDEWPRVRWQEANTLEIRVPNLAEVKPPEPQFENVRITLTYCGDNPGDRARLAAYKAAVLQWQRDVSAWAQLRKHDAQGAGPRPPRPEEPRLAAGRCID
jgi:hypothetical protein